MSLISFDLQGQLESLGHQQLLRQTRIISAGVTPNCQRDGRTLVNFSSNDYLGLASHPALRDAIHQHLQEHAVGAGAAHLVTGHSSLHDVLEQRLAQETGYASALLFSTGYMANLGVLSALMSREDTVYQDRLNHASLLDGARLSGARLRRYPHRDMVQLGEWLSADPAQRTLIATDQVFSMDGTEAPLSELRELAERHQAALMIDDAHGFGLRPHPLPPVDIYMGTLGKATGTFGAFVAGSTELIELLRSRARTYCFTTATPPLLAAATLAALDVLHSEPHHRVKLQENIHFFQQGLSELGWPAAHLPASQTAIQPLIVGSANRALRAAEALEQQGLLVMAIRPPTVPMGTSRLRITLSAAHTPEHISLLLQALKTLREGGLV